MFSGLSILDSVYLRQSFRIIVSRILVIINCMECVHIKSFSGPYFPTLGVNMERYRVSLRIHSACVKIRTRKTPNTDTFQGVLVFEILVFGFSVPCPRLFFQKIQMRCSIEKTRKRIKMARNISLEALIDSYFLFSSYSRFFCENSYRLLAVKGILMQI